ncbi:Hypothetical predicted protein [Paramuricea clavata]|uniref:Uncharacterized protein n=1 Tax=Paramuricea clavata TaxID=317549 RepID=A0A6S7JRA3_PARCT|nr:Hypothetical predicted protein [Paramuricea clavata]
MPKFAKTCNNPFHDEWSDGFEGSSRIVNLRAYNLDEFARAFAKFSSDEKNCEVTPKKINQICKNCLQQNLKKKNFIRYLPQLPSTDEIERKLEDISTFLRSEPDQAEDEGPASPNQSLR